MFNIFFKKENLIFFTLFFLLAISGQVNAQTKGVAYLEATIIRDEVFKASPVSGEWLVGVHWKSELIAERPSLQAYIPHRMAGKKLCTTGISISGLFQTVFEYKIPQSWKAGMANLAFPTRHTTKAKKMDIDSSGVVIQTGPCNDPNPEFIVNYWNAAADSPVTPTLVLNLNSQNSDEVFVYFGKKMVRPIKCLQVKNSNRIAFDFQCNISVPQNGPLDVEIEVQRFRKGIENIPQFAKLILER